MKRQPAGSTASPHDRAGGPGGTTPRLDTGNGYQMLRRLLAEAGLRACRIEPDAKHEAWTIFAIQATAEGTWKIFSLSVGNARLHDASADARARRLLVTHLATALAAGEPLRRDETASDHPSGR